MMAQVQMQQPVPKQASASPGQPAVVGEVPEKKSRVWLWIIILLIVIGVGALIWWLI